MEIKQSYFLDAIGIFSYLYVVALIFRLYHLIKLKFSLQTLKTNIRPWLYDVTCVSTWFTLAAGMSFVNDRITRDVIVSYLPPVVRLSSLLK